MNKKLENTFFNSDKTFIVAEIGINHNGDMGLANELINAAAEAGADSVKFQNYRTEDFVNDRSLTIEYQSQGKKVKESQYDLFKRCELNRGKLAKLKEICDSAGVIFHSSPTSIEGIEDLKSVGCQILKNGSDYLTNLRLIRAMGETGLLTVLSTGMATLEEIEDAVQIYNSTGNKNLILLHCTSSYPTDAGEVNLSRIKSLSKKFDIHTGFSDHSKGVIAAVGASLLGARWIEKHFTLDHSLSGPDHWFSMNPIELKELVLSIRYAEKIMGDSKIAPTSSEIINRKEYRLSCVASRDIDFGVTISHEDIDFQRPGNGIPPSGEDVILGKKIFCSIKKGQQFKKEHFNE